MIIVLGTLSATLVLAAAALADGRGKVSPDVLVPPDGNIACSANGTTILAANQTHDTPVCLSYETAFYSQGGGSNCYFDGYYASIYAYPSYAQRFSALWCRDGLWHFSTAWGSNEARYSEMQTTGAGVYWAMVQYAR
jgi:hypothetical protein